MGIKRIIKIHFSLLLFLAFLAPANVAHAQTPVFLDPFTADNGTLLHNYNNGNGVTWRWLSQYSASIQNNSVAFEPAQTVYTTNYTWSEDADISVTMNPSLFGSGGTQGFGISDGSSCGLEAVIGGYVNQGSNHSFNITWGDCKQSGSSVTVNKTYSNSNLIHTFKITKRGNTYNLYIDNDAAVQSLTSTYYGQYVGIIRGYNSSGLDNFSIDQEAARQTEDCLVTTSPANKTLSIGGTAQISASVSSGLGSASITRMRFGSYNTKKATVSPTEDTDTPYSTTVTAVATGDTAVWATADLSDGRTCQSRADTDTNIKVKTNTKTPLILIPGIMGSKLAVMDSEPIIPAITAKQAINPFDPNSPCIDILFFPYSWSYSHDELLWVDENSGLFWGSLKYAAGCSNYLDAILFDDSGQPLYSSVRTNGEITDLPYNDSTIPYLKQQGYTPNEDLFIYPFDWRKDVSITVADLDTLINNVKDTTGAPQVDILAHSMGGLVASQYISESGRASKIHTLIKVASPNVGTPQALAQLLYNICALPRIILPFMEHSPITCIPNPQEANKLVQNFPGAFDLLPSEKYYELYPEMYPYYDSKWKVEDNPAPIQLNYDQLRTLLDTHYHKI